MNERKIKEKILAVHELINKVWQKKEQETDKNMQIAYNEQIWYFEGKLDAFRDVLGIDEININKIREELK